ncbi:MAG TPA: MBL fold metallo-hydrolase [Devosia sp.]|nr:MBL fold metallo-hydrolase [Devosia sp.]
MPSYICTTCGTGYAETDAPRETCLICADDRQYVSAAGQAWTTLEQLSVKHVNELRDLEPGLIGIGSKPQIAIGQRALAIARPNGGVLWDCTPLITDDAIAALKAKGGIKAIAISHPHFYTTMVDWSRALGGVPIWLHEDNRDWVMRPDPAIQFWSGESKSLDDGITLVRTGGHFPGSTVLHWAEGAGGKGVLMTGDSIMVVPDTRWVSFMYSYPNLIPLNARAVERIVKSVRAYPFDRIYAGWWDRVLDRNAKSALQRSAERYIAAIR